MLEYNIKKVIKFKNSSIIKSEGVNMKIADILKVTAGKLICGDENIEVENFEKDNRCIKEGDVFVAIKGENFDGNKFYKEAIKSELGDLMWYIALICKNLDINMEQLEEKKQINETNLSKRETMIQME